MLISGRGAQTTRSCVHRDGPFGLRAYTQLYAIDAPDIGRIKFGKTSDIKKRFGNIANMSPAPVELLGWAWMPDVAEGYVFDYLKADRCHGEWFYRTEATRSIAALIAAKQVEHLAEVIGLQFLLTEHRPSNVSWGSN